MYFIKNKMKVGKLLSEQEQLLTKLQVLQGQIPNHKKELEEKKQIEEEMNKYKDVTIDILSKVNSGVFITLLNQKKLSWMNQQKFDLEQKTMK